MKKYQLMAPGPTPVPPNVLLAMARPIIHHRAAEYDALFLEVREGLKRLVQTQQDVVTPACTGTGAMEAAVANTLSAGDRVIVSQCRRVAQRWLAICKAYTSRGRAQAPPRGHGAP
jgi:aspartate aminotransferase-like enzyme